VAIALIAAFEQRSRAVSAIDMITAGASFEVIASAEQIPRIAR